MKKIIILILTLFLISCANNNPNGYDVIEENVTDTNITEEIIDTSLQVVADELNVFAFSSEGQCLLIVTETNETYLIDCGQSNYLTTIKKIKNLGYSKLDNIVITNPSLLDTQFIDKMVLKFKPTMIYETGIPNSNERYKTFNFSKTEVVTEELIFDGFELIPTYLKGFYPSPEDNSIIINFEDMIVMSRCLDTCENFVTKTQKDILYLANYGVCLTNTIDFILEIDPKEIISKTDVCLDLQEDLELLEIPINKYSENDLQIILGENYEIRKWWIH